MKVFCILTNPCSMESEVFTYDKDKWMPNAIRFRADLIVQEDGKVLKNSYATESFPGEKATLDEINKNLEKANMNKAQKAKVQEYKNILDRPHNTFHPELVENFAKELLAIDPTPDPKLYVIKITETSGYKYISTFNSYNNTTTEEVTNKNLLEVAHNLGPALMSFEAGDYVKSTSGQVWTVEEA